MNCATGDFWHEFTDFQIPGRGVGVALDFKRTYSSSAASTDGPLGFGWTDSYNLSLVVDSTTGDATVHEDNGSTVPFRSNGGGGFTAAPGVLAVLQQNGDGTYTYTRTR